MFSNIKGTLVILTKSSIERNKSYHWNEGNNLLKQPSFGGVWPYGSYPGIFHTLIGISGPYVVDGVLAGVNSCSRL